MKNLFPADPSALKRPKAGMILQILLDWWIPSGLMPSRSIGWANWKVTWSAMKFKSHKNPELKP